MENNLKEYMIELNQFSVYLEALVNQQYLKKTYNTLKRRHWYVWRVGGPG